MALNVDNSIILLFVILCKIWLDYVDTILKLINHSKKEIGIENPADILEILMPLIAFALVSEYMSEVNKAND